MTSGWFVALQADPGGTPFDTGMGTLRAFLALAFVLAVLAGVLWLLRRGGVVSGRGSRQAMAVESALSLGERRSLVIVTVEGRRLLLGLAPTQVALIAELQRPAVAFGSALERAVASGVDGARS